MVEVQSLLKSTMRLGGVALLDAHEHLAAHMDLGVVYIGLVPLGKARGPTVHTFCLRLTGHSQGAAHEELYSNGLL